jgi:hypothetical protein
MGLNIQLPKMARESGFIEDSPQQVADPTCVAGNIGAHAGQSRYGDGALRGIRSSGARNALA